MKKQALSLGHDYRELVFLAANYLSTLLSCMLTTVQFSSLDEDALFVMYSRQQHAELR